ncbi:phosphoribosyltransferase family protein [Paenibacillus lautus]|uniref:phosphoribosyltransferase family protein n=1 Tax=Paenibacillus lautus TaxID=1401 RepID=UPI003D2B6445
MRCINSIETANIEEFIEKQNLAKNNIKSKTLEGLIEYYNAKSFNNFYHEILNSGMTEHNFLVKNRYVGPEYKKYKLIASVVSMTSTYPGNSGIMSLIALDIIRQFKNIEVDYILGLTQGGVPLATYISMLTGIPVIVSRVRSTTHYDLPNQIIYEEPDDEFGSYFICCEPGKRVLIVEDEITSGKTLRSVVNALITANIIVNGIGAAYKIVASEKNTDSINELINDIGIKVYTSITLSIQEELKKEGIL